MTWAAVPVLLLAAALALAVPSPAAPHSPPGRETASVNTANDSAVGNFSSALNRLVVLVAAGGSAILALVWSRVAFSWFSNDVTKKVQAKERARDALIGTLVFTAAITGLAWSLAQWVLTGA
ncbi:MAG: hypothetical protein L3K03_03150 [Thermoplasmata archaeon]|nr:hypothetical protein [Thermoplasmata archaeon]